MYSFSNYYILVVWATVRPSASSSSESQLSATRPTFPPLIGPVGGAPQYRSQAIIGSRLNPESAPDGRNVPVIGWQLAMGYQYRRRGKPILLDPLHFPSASEMELRHALS